MKFSKRGGEKLLGENTIGLIVAIIGILLILVVLAILAGFQNQNKQKEQAKATLQDITNKLSQMSTGDIENVIVYLPFSWTLVSFDKNTKVFNGFTVPSSYTFKDSLCIFSEDKKTAFCQVVRSPVLDQDRLFIYYINGYKKFTLGYDGINYQMGFNNLDIKKQDLVDQSVFAGYVKDNTWRSVVMDIGFYYTVYEGDYKNKYESYWKGTSLPGKDIDYYCNKIPADQKRFYEMVMCYGVGLGENFSLYTRETIKEKKEDSTFFIGCPDCELGYTNMMTDRTIGRTLYIGKETDTLYPGVVVYMEIDCSNVQDTCKVECEKWNDRYYVIEGIDPTGKAGNKIFLFAGGGEERYNLIKNCLPGRAKFFIDSTIGADKLKIADKATTQLS
jgi:type II secretory pathway pseudopilin PulG